jgi:hypothetical protein
MKGRTTLMLTVMALFMLAASSASAQGQAPVVCVVYPIQDLSPAGSDTQQYGRPISDAVAAAASAHGYSTIADDAWHEAAKAQSLDPGRVFTQAAALAIARVVGANLAVTGSFSVQNDQIYYSIQCWDVEAGRLASGVQETTPFNLAFFTALSQKLSDDLFPSVRLEQKETPRIVLSSPDEGMEVIVSGDTSIGQIRGGEVTWPLTGLAPGTKVTVEKRKTGFHTDYQDITLVTGAPIPLSPLAPAHTTSVELNETVGQLLGTGATLRSYLVPDWFYLYDGGYAWLQPPANFALRFAFHGDILAGIGGYLGFPPTSWFRVGISTGAGMVLTFLSTPGFPNYTDFYLDIGSLLIEATFAQTTFFLRTDFKYALGIGENLLGAGWIMDGGPSVTLGVLLR